MTVADDYILNELAPAVQKLYLELEMNPDRSPIPVKYPESKENFRTCVWLLNLIAYRVHKTIRLNKDSDTSTAKERIYSFSFDNQGTGYRVDILWFLVPMIPHWLSLVFKEENPDYIIDRQTPPIGWRTIHITIEKTPFIILLKWDNSEEEELRAKMLHERNQLWIPDVNC